MLLKVLIVDDDILTQTSLKAMIDWGKNGFEICGDASNGFLAIQMINNLLPDIVITDMNMPIMNGIALIEFIERDHPEIKVIALSGYDDFDYVKQSMKRGALDYILKHKLDSSTLLNALKIAYDSIINGREALDRKHHIEEQLASARTMLKQEFINQLIFGKITSKAKIEENIHSLDVELDLKNLIVVAVEVDGYSFIEERYSILEQDSQAKAFVDICEKTLSDWGKALIYHIEKGKYVIIFSLGCVFSSLYIYNQIATAIVRLKTSIKRYLNITASFSISSICNHINEISRYYEEADKTLKDKFYKGKDTILRKNLEGDVIDSFLSLDLKDEKNITLFIKSLEREKINAYIDGIFNKIMNSKISHKSTQMIAAEMINIVNKVARESGIDIAQVYSNEEIPYSKLQKYDTLVDIKEWILSIYDKLITLLESMKIDGVYSEITKKAIEFINTNYRANISLNDAAAFIGVNSSYLSRIFKEDCGKGFVEYVNSLRVEKAKLFIEKGNIKLKDIVKEVGFSNYNYFFKVFKDISDMTPLEYEETYKK